MIQTRFFRVFLIPAGVVLSTMFGGGYASGREVATFVSDYGPWGGVLAALVVAVSFGVVLSLCIEIARRFAAYDYGSFSQILLGRAHVVYEIALLIGLIVVVAVAATAAGSTLEDHFGIPAASGTVLMMAIAIMLTYFGRRVVALSMTVTATLLLALLVGLVVVAAQSDARAIGDTFANDTPDPAFWQRSGAYAIATTAFVPLILFLARDIRTRGESIMAGMFAGLVVALPALLLHIAFMSSYPGILDEDVPSYVIARSFGGERFVNFFVAVLFVLIVQTGVGVIQGVIERANDWSKRRRRVPMTHLQQAGISTGVLVITLVLSSLGLVTLVTAGYGSLALVYLLSFTVPLFTVGVRRVTAPVADVGRNPNR